MKQPLKVLILEDFVYDAELVVHELKKMYSTVEAKIVVSQSEYIEELTNFKPDVVLVDHTLPQFDSVEALKIFKELKLNIPFILVTGTVSEEFAVSIIKQGADDYILKQSLIRIGSAVDAAIKKKEAEFQREMALESLKSKNIELIEINQELDHLVYSASHDLRSPVSSILGLLNLINSDNDFETIKTYIGLLEKTVNKLDKTIKDIIEYSYNRRKEVTNEELNLSTLIQECFDNLKFIYLEKKAEVNIEADSSVPFFSDRERIKMILCHILSNAIIYGNSEKPIININIKVNADKALFKINDNGEGLTEAQVDKIFDMFYKASLKSKGAGLGLYIVKEALRKLNGTINVESTIGEGATFIIEIPNNI